MVEHRVRRAGGVPNPTPLRVLSAPAEPRMRRSSRSAWKGSCTRSRSAACSTSTSRKTVRRLLAVRGAGPPERTLIERMAARRVGSNVGACPISVLLHLGQIHALECAGRQSVHHSPQERGRHSHHVGGRLDLGQHHEPSVARHLYVHLADGEVAASERRLGGPGECWCRRWPQVYDVACAVVAKPFPGTQLTLSAARRATAPVVHPRASASGAAALTRPAEVSRSVARLIDMGAAQNLVVMVDQIFSSSRHLNGVRARAWHARWTPLGPQKQRRFSMTVAAGGRSGVVSV